MRPADADIACAIPQSNPRPPSSTIVLGIVLPAASLVSAVGLLALDLELAKPGHGDVAHVLDAGVALRDLLMQGSYTEYDPLTFRRVL